MWRLGGFVVVWLVAQLLFESFAGPLWGGLSALVGEPVPMYPVSMLLGAWVGTLVVFRQAEPQSWAQLGFAEGSWHWRPLLAGALLGTALIGGTALLLWVGGWLRFERVASPVFMQDTWWGTALRLLVVLGPAALWEELAFRGTLYSAFREATGDGVPQEATPRRSLGATLRTTHHRMQDEANVTARLVTSVLFGLVHLTNPGAGVRTTALVMLAGWGLALLRERAGVPAAFMAHLAWNWIMAAVLHLPVSGLPFATPGYRATVHGPDWLTGGSWGPEGGLAAAFVLGGAVLWASRPRRTSHDLQTSHA